MSQYLVQCCAKELKHSCPYHIWTAHARSLEHGESHATRCWCYHSRRQSIQLVLPCVDIQQEKSIWKWKTDQQNHILIKLLYAALLNILRMTLLPAILVKLDVVWFRISHFEVYTTLQAELLQSFWNHTYSIYICKHMANILGWDITQKHIQFLRNVVIVHTKREVKLNGYWNRPYFNRIRNYTSIEVLQATNVNFNSISLLMRYMKKALAICGHQTYTW